MLLLLLMQEAVMASSQTFRNQLLQQTFQSVDCQTYANDSVGVQESNVPQMYYIILALSIQL